jgi:hypothetical protein
LHLVAFAIASDCILFPGFADTITQK